MNQKGSTLLSAVIVSSVILTASGFIMYQANQTNKVSRLPRVKAEMVSLESQIHELALSPQSYTNCQTVLDTNTTAASGCQVNPSVFTNLTKKVSGAKCDSEKDGCGIEIENLTLSPTGRFSAKLVYTGSDLPLAPIEIGIDIPKEVLQANLYTCPDATPIFIGIDSSGRIQCRAIPNSSLCDVPGKYIASISKTTLAVEQCADIPVNMGCPSDQFISDFEWLGGGSLNIKCSPRVNAFTFFNFKPTVTEGPPDTLPNLPDPVRPADSSSLVSVTTGGDP